MNDRPTSLADQRAADLAAAETVARQLTDGGHLPGWRYQPPGSRAWAPTLVHTGGATIMVTRAHHRLHLRGVRPDGPAVYRWEPLAISVAAHTAPARIAGHLTRRLIPQLLTQHADAVQVLDRHRDEGAARTAAAAALRDLVPAGLRAGAWPGDTDDVRWQADPAPDSGESGHSGRIRLLSDQHIDLTIDRLTLPQAVAVLRHLFASSSQH